MDADEQLWMLFQDEEYQINASSRNRAFQAMFFKYIGESVTSANGRQIFEAFANTAFDITV